MPLPVCLWRPFYSNHHIPCPLSSLPIYHSALLTKSGSFRFLIQLPSVICRFYICGFNQLWIGNSHRGKMQKVPKSVLIFTAYHALYLFYIQQWFVGMLLEPPPVDITSSVSSIGCFVSCVLHSVVCVSHICTECVQNFFLGILCTVQHSNYMVLNYISYCKLFMPGIFHLI